MEQGETGWNSGAERVFVGLGSNLGDREENLRAALNRISAVKGTRVAAVSSFRETPPWGVEDQPPFLNAVAEIRTELAPVELLRAVKAIEVELGRVPSYRWGPRLIDIDLLTYGERSISMAELTLPHPNILNRPFVWEPFEEIAPEVVEKLRRATVPL
ncbi:MAG: 2-amino-4-hydroxy-6-hydroxymethyldihydropteridine diphosphokinase [Actinomycetota bacterium]